MVGIRTKVLLLRWSHADQVLAPRVHDQSVVNSWGRTESFWSPSCRCHTWCLSSSPKVWQSGSWMAFKMGRPAFSSTYLCCCFLLFFTNWKWLRNGEWKSLTKWKSMVLFYHRIYTNICIVNTQAINPGCVSRTHFTFEETCNETYYSLPFYIFHHCFGLYCLQY